MKHQKTLFVYALLWAVLCAADTGYDLFQKGLAKERAETDLPGAIKIYRQVVQHSASNRKLAAEALFRIGECQHALGSAEARKAFDRIVSDFADQREIAARARARLAGMNDSGITAGLTARQIVCCWTGKKAGLEVSPAPDGKSLAMVDWKTGDLAIREIDSGEIRRFGLKKSWESPEFAQEPLFSPDQRQIAYNWFSAGEKKYQFQIISTESGAKPRTLVNPPEVAYFAPSGWSADGKSILASIWRGSDDTTQIAWISAVDGTIKPLKSLEWRQPGRPSLSPDGRYVAYDVLEDRGRPDRDIYILATDGSSEAAAVKGPGIDNSPVWTPDGNHLIFTSNRSGTVGLYALDVHDGRPQGKPRLLKPDAGRVLLRGFVRSGALYYLQTTTDENIYKAELDHTTGKLRGEPVMLANTYVGKNRTPVVSPDGKYVAYFSARGPESAALVVKSLETKIEKVFPGDGAPAGIPAWLPDGRALLFFEIGGSTGPVLYRAEVESGRITPVARVQDRALRPAQVGLSADGGMIYSPANEPDGTARVVAVSVPSGQLKTIYKIETGYVWAVSLSPDGRTLAITMGTTGQKQTRSLLLMNTNGGEVRTLFTNSDLKSNSGVAWTSDGAHVLFARSTKTGEGAQVWRVRATGGEPVATDLRGTELREISTGPGGLVTYTAGSSNQVELWSLDNLLPMLKASR